MGKAGERWFLEPVCLTVDSWGNWEGAQNAKAAHRLSILDK